MRMVRTRNNYILSVSLEDQFFDIGDVGVVIVILDCVYVCDVDGDFVG
jgi:hypothetical protein